MRTILCTLLFITAALTNAQTVISLNGITYSEVTMPKRDVEQVEDGIIVTYYFDNAVTQQDLLYNDCVLWRIPGFGLNETVGEPSTPFRWDSFSLPQNTRISIEVLDSSYVDFPMQLAPARPALIDSDTVGHTLETVLPIVSYDGFFPASLIESFEGNAYRGVPLLDVGISPLQYDYKLQIVRAYKMIKYKITFIASSRSNGATSAVDINDNYLSLATINPPSTTNQVRCISETTDAEQSTRDYLIITNSALSPAVEEFAEWKRTLGFRTFIAVNDNWSIQAVKDTVSNYYNAPNNNLYYLLIVGDENIVPAISSSYSDSECVTDLHYACIDGANDYVPDIYYGRIPTDNTSEAEVVFDKIRSYEGNPTLDTSFYNTGLNCAYFQDDTIKIDDFVILPDTYADRRFAQTVEEVLQYVRSQGKTVNRVYFTKSETTPLFWNNGIYSSGEPIPSYLRKPEFPWNGSSTDIANYINEGAFYVLHRDHGTFYGWEEPAFEINHIPNLINSDKLPVVFSVNCNTGRYHVSSTIDCFAEAFLKHVNGGCVAIYAATGISYSGYNDALATGMFDAIWPEPGLRSIFPSSSNGIGVTPTPSPTYELGQILEVGMVRMKETWGSTRTSGAEYTRELFHLFGDPSMQIYTSCPTNIQIPEVCRINNSIYVKVKDGEAHISFYTPSTQQVATYDRSNVVYQTESNDVIICISRHDCIPYITNISNNPVYIQNETTSEDKNYSGNIIKTGRNVTDKSTTGDVTFNSGTVNMVGNRVELQAGTKVSKGAVLRIDKP
ncbi:MAG: hypothetical protein IJZ31_00315 [Bacteroidaceae bacterium]|nr:hypothetical protein [Bacteroidaceae bacterium]